MYILTQISKYKYMRYATLFTLIIFYDFGNFGIIINFVSSDLRHNPVLFMNSLKQIPDHNLIMRTRNSGKIFST